MNNLLRQSPKCVVYYLLLCFNLATGHAESAITERTEQPVNALELSGNSIRFSNIGVDTSIDKLALLRQRYRTKDSIDLLTTGKKKNILKIAPGAPMLNYIIVNYERRIAKRQSLEMKLGIVGLGFGPKYYNSIGAYLGVGYKVNLSNYSVLLHELHGIYLRPEFVIGGYDVQFKHNIYSSGNPIPTVQKESHNVNFHVYMLSLGKQYIFNRFTLDYFVSVGKGFYNQSEKNLGIIETIQYGNPMNISIKNVSGNANVYKVGFNIGYLF